MHPIFLTFGPITIYYFSIFFLLSCALFSFLFWRALRDRGVEEEKIFDLTLYSALAAIIGARLTFAASHWSLFNSDWLRILALWVTPGLSLYGGFLAGGIAAFLILRSLKIRLVWVLDAFALSFPLALALGRMGALLDGSEVGRLTPFPFGIHYVGHAGLRHPVQLYEIFGLIIIFILLIWLNSRSRSSRSVLSLLGPISVTLASFWFFLLEFIKDGSVYWAGVSPNQWLLVFIFAQSVAMILVRTSIYENIRRRLFTGRQK